MVRIIFYILNIVFFISCSKIPKEFINITVENNTNYTIKNIKVFDNKNINIMKIDELERKKQWNAKFYIKGDMDLNIIYYINKKKYSYRNIGYFTYGLSKNNCAKFIIESNNLLFDSNYNSNCKGKPQIVKYTNTK